MKPQHFDILGSLAFIYVAGFALYVLTHGTDVPMWSIVLLAIVGITGLIVDLSIVYRYFIQKQ